jgi:transposase
LEPDVIPDLSETDIFIKPGRTDMRKQINGLTVIVQDDMELNPFSPSIFLFCNRERKILKALYWDKNGFCLWQKKIEKESFPWPKDESEAQKITYEQLKLLLSGIDFWKAHKALNYCEVL